MAEITETVVNGAEVTTAVLEELNINEYNSMRVFDGDREIMLHDLKVVIYQDTEKKNKPLLITIEADSETNNVCFQVEPQHYRINSFDEKDSIMKQYVEKITKEKFDSSKVEASPDYVVSFIYFYGNENGYSNKTLLVTMEHDGKKILFPEYYPLVTEPYVLQNTGGKNYYVQEYKAGEFGIYENGKLYADCFESVEQAQAWYDAEVKRNKKLKALNDAIFEDIENAIVPIEEKNDDAIPCIYCKENPSSHFLCDSCGAGMCDECYDAETEHTEHYNKPLEECEDIYIDAIKKVCNNEDPDYICEACMKKALSLKPQDFADEANKILEGTSLKAVIIETSELYGEDDEVNEDDSFFMQPMYEGYIEDSDEEEINGTRAGRYCSLVDVSNELESFAKDAKFYHIQNTIQEIVGERFEDKTDLELYLQKKYDIEGIADVDESGLVKDYAFVGLIFEDIGYIDIYYLKIPYGNETIYITEISATYE